MQHRWRGATLALVTLVAVSCGGDAGDGASPDDAETLEPAPSGDDTGSGEDTRDDTGGTEDEEDPVATDDPEAFAIADAAQRAGVDPADVSVVRNEDVTWPDGAIGCPEPDQFYTQALVPGYRVVVEAGGEQFHYHGEAGQPAAYCANPSEPANEGGVVDR
ncbi:MAG: hypothetical protein WD378_05200 [Egicoccus sp.]